MGCCCGLSIWLTARRGGRAIAECMVEQQPHGVSQQCHQNALCSTCKILLTVISKVWLNHSFSSIKAGGHGCHNASIKTRAPSVMMMKNKRKGAINCFRRGKAISECLAKVPTPIFSGFSVIWIHKR